MGGEISGPAVIDRSGPRAAARLSFLNPPDPRELDTGHPLLTELLERGQRNTAVFERIVIFSEQKLNCSK